MISRHSTRAYEPSHDEKKRSLLVPALIVGLSLAAVAVVVIVIASVRTRSKKKKRLVFQNSPLLGSTKPTTVTSFAAPPVPPPERVPPKEDPALQDALETARRLGIEAEKQPKRAKEPESEEEESEPEESAEELTDEEESEAEESEDEPTPKRSNAKNATKSATRDARVTAAYLHALAQNQDESPDGDIGVLGEQEEIDE